MIPTSPASLRRFTRERRKLEAMIRQFQRPDIHLALIVAQQTLLWAGDSEKAGYLSPSKFIAFARTLKKPSKSLHPTERRRR